ARARGARGLRDLRGGLLGLRLRAALCVALLAPARDDLLEAPDPEDEDERAEADRKRRQRDRELLADRVGSGRATEDLDEQGLLHSGAAGREWHRGGHRVHAQDE